MYIYTSIQRTSTPFSTRMLPYKPCSSKRRHPRGASGPLLPSPQTVYPIKHPTSLAGCALEILVFGEIREKKRQREKGKGGRGGGRGARVWGYNPVEDDRNDFT